VRCMRACPLHHELVEARLLAQPARASMAPSARHYMGLGEESDLRAPFEELSTAARRHTPAALLTGGLLGVAALIAFAAPRPQAETEGKPFLQLNNVDDSYGPSGAAPPAHSFIVPAAMPAAAAAPPVATSPPIAPPAQERKTMRVRNPTSTPAPQVAAPAPPPTAPPAPPPAPAPRPAPEDCASGADNCWDKRCCANPAHTCFMKDKNWAGCMDSCAVGVHETDPEFARQPWTCYTVHLNGPATPPAQDSAPLAAQEQDSGAPAGSGDAHSSPIWEGADPSLFCFQIIRTGTYELKVVRKQKELGASIFGCDASSVFADQAIDLGGGYSTKSVGDLSTGSGKATHFANTDIFSRAYDMLKESGDIFNYDFNVKVDPDAVFMPVQLRQQIKLYVPKAGTKVYFQNCYFQDKNWMFGAIEVLSGSALRAYFDGREAQCRSQLDYDNMGEDTFLARCLDLLGVEAKQDYDLLADGYCNEAPGDCRSGQVAYHPFKDPGSWEACFHSASSA